MTMSRTGKQGPWQAVVRCWKAHPRIAQVVSFFLQRKVTFKSSGNIAWQAMWYFAAFLVITVGANALYGIYQPWLYSTLGEAIGGLIAAFLQCCIAFWVFFPIMKLIFLSQKKA